MVWHLGGAHASAVPLPIKAGRPVLRILMQILGPLVLGLCAVVGGSIQVFEQVLVIDRWHFIVGHLLHLGLEHPFGLEELIPAIAQVFLIFPESLLFVHYFGGRADQPQPQRVVVGAVK